MSAAHPKRARTKLRTERVVDLHEPATLEAVSRYMMDERPRDAQTPLIFLVGRQGTKNEGHVGVRSIETRNSIWALDKAREVQDSYQPMHIYNSSRTPELISYLEYRRDRRMLRRVPVKAGARVTSKARRDPAWGVCTDINRSGCFVESAWPLSADATVEISLRLNGREIAARGVVRSASQNRGMGIEFVEMGEADRQYLEELAQEKQRAPHSRAQGHSGSR